MGFMTGFWQISRKIKPPVEKATWTFDPGTMHNSLASEGDHITLEPLEGAPIVTNLATRQRPASDLMFADGVRSADMISDSREQNANEGAEAAGCTLTKAIEVENFKEEAGGRNAKGNRAVLMSRSTVDKTTAARNGNKNMAAQATGSVDSSFVDKNSKLLDTTKCGTTQCATAVRPTLADFSPTASCALGRQDQNEHVTRYVYGSERKAGEATKYDGSVANLEKVCGDNAHDVEKGRKNNAEDATEYSQGNSIGAHKLRDVRFTVFPSLHVLPNRNRNAKQVLADRNRLARELLNATTEEVSIRRDILVNDAEPDAVDTTSRPNAATTPEAVTTRDQGSQKKTDSPGLSLAVGQHQLAYNPQTKEVANLTLDTETRSQSVTAATRTTVMLLRELAILLVAISHCLIGGKMFMLLEGQAELDMLEDMHILSNNFVEDLHTTAKMSDSDPTRDDTDDLFKERADALLTRFKKRFYNLTCNKGLDLTGKPKWSLSGALLYSASVMTTVGYRQFAPVTLTGRVVTMIYALFGIPVTVLCLHKLGHGMSHLLKTCYHTVLSRHLAKSGDLYPPERRVPWPVPVSVAVGFVMLSAYLFSTWEDWPYENALYFCVTTLMTIGFGDLVPGVSGEGSAIDQRRVAVILFMLFGISLMVMCYRLLKPTLRTIYYVAGRRLGFVSKTAYIKHYEFKEERHKIRQTLISSLSARTSPLRASLRSSAQNRSFRSSTQLLGRSSLRQLVYQNRSSGQESSKASAQL